MEKKPSVKITSCKRAKIAPIPYKNSNLNPMYTRMLNKATNIAHSPYSLNSEPTWAPTYSNLKILNSLSLDNDFIKKSLIEIWSNLGLSLSLIITSLLVP